MSDKDQTIEQALDSIHADRNAPLNMANLADRAQKIDGSITEEEIWEYMTPMFGWNPTIGFWSGEEIG